MVERALSFGSVASAYERFRPGYPDDLVERVQSYAGRPLLSALEIGAGTGKATRVFAARGIAVTASDPDAAMLAELRHHVPVTVTVVEATLEELPTPAAYDLVFAAASLHWTEAQERWARIASMLTTGGVFASFGGPTQLVDVDLDAALRAIRAPLLPSDDVASPDGTPAEAELQWPGTELSRSPLFTDVVQTTIARRLVLSAADYLGHLATVSAYLQLTPIDRDRLLARMREAMPDRVEVDADITVHLARVRHATP